MKCYLRNITIWYGILVIANVDFRFPGVDVKENVSVISGKLQLNLPLDETHLDLMEPTLSN